MAETIRDLLVKLRIEADTKKAEDFDRAVEDAKKTMEETVPAAKDAAKALESLAKEHGRGAASADVQAEALDDAARALEDTTQATEGAGAAMAETEVQAKRLDRTTATLRGTIQTIGKVTLAVTGMFVGLAGAMGLSAASSARHAERLEQEADALGVTTDALQEMQHVFDQIPIGGEQTAVVLSKINRSALAAQRGIGSHADAWERLGVSVADLDGQDIPGMFEALAEAYATAGDRQERLASLSVIFGEDMANKIAPALAGGAAEIRALREEARAYGLVTSKEMVQRASQAQRQFQLLRSVASSFRLEVGSALIPAVMSLTNGMLEWWQSNREWISLGIEDAAQKIATAFEWIGDRVESADEYVRENLGGWQNLFIQTGKVLMTSGLILAIPKMVAGLGALKAAAVAAFGAIYTAGLPVSLAVTAVVGGLVALGLAVDDIITWLRGGESVFGRWLGFLGLNEVALDTVRGNLAAFADMARATWGAVKDLADAFAQLLMPSAEETATAFSLLKLVGMGAFSAFIRIAREVGRVMRTLTVAIQAFGRGGAAAIERIAKPLESVRAMFQGVGSALGLAAPSDVAMDWAQQAAQNFASGTVASAAGSSSVSHRASTFNFGGLTQHFPQGVSPDDVNENINGAIQAMLRQAAAQIEGGEL